MTWRHRSREGFIHFAMVGCAGLLLAGIAQSGIINTLDLLLYDSVVSRRFTSSAERHPITIVGIDENDLAVFGWPIDDHVLCRAIDQAFQYNVLAIGLDLYRDQGVGSQQDCLQERLKQHHNLVVIFNAAENINPPPNTPPQQKSFNDLIVDSDGVIRRDLVHVAGQDVDTVSFPLRLIDQSGRVPGLLEQLNDPAQAETLGPWLHSNSGGYRQLDAAGYQRLLPFDKPGSFQSLSLSELAESGSSLDKEQLNNQILLIGSTAPSLKDLFEIPHSRLNHGERQLRIPGVEVHALRTAALLNGLDGASWKLRTPGPGINFSVELIALLLGIGIGESFKKLRSSMIATFSAPLILLSSSIAMLWWCGIWVATALPLITLPLMAGVGLLRRGGMNQFQKQQIQRLLGQTTSPEVALELWDQRDSLLQDGRFKGQQMIATVLFSDTRDFTSIAELLTPTEVLTWLNRGMTSLIKEITTREGIINKFTGDGILAVFGAPLSQGVEKDAHNGITAALAIQTAISRLNQELADEGAPRMQIRIGIHTGPVIAGSLGSSERLEYTVMGDTVNCASRLEGIAKEQQNNDCRVLVSRQTMEACNSDFYSWRQFGRIQAKGRLETIDVIELNPHS